jgi:hypothetical protein
MFADRIICHMESSNPVIVVWLCAFSCRLNNEWMLPVLWKPVGFKVALRELSAVELDQIDDSGRSFSNGNANPCNVQATIGNRFGSVSYLLVYLKHVKWLSTIHVECLGGWSITDVPQTLTAKWNRPFSVGSIVLVKSCQHRSVEQRTTDKIIQYMDGVDTVRWNEAKWFPLSYIPWKRGAVQRLGVGAQILQTPREHP